MNDSMRDVGAFGVQRRDKLVLALQRQAGLAAASQPWPRTRCTPTPQTQNLRTARRDSPAKPGFHLARLMHLDRGAY